MLTSHIKKFIAIVTFAGIFSCKKSETTPTDYSQYTFDGKGKSFSFKQPKQINTTPPQTKYCQITIPDGAVSEENYLEYYTFYCDTAEIKKLYIDWWVGDVNFIGSSAKSLSKPATIKLPMPWNTYSATTNYKPYKIKVGKNENIVTAINDPSKRELITNYTWDNNERYVIIEVTDLNAAYILAAPK